jgi:hypothetical protein
MQLGTRFRKRAQHAIQLEVRPPSILRRVSEPLLLVASDHSTRQSAVFNPEVRMRASVATGHSPKELAIIYDEVRKRELMRIE